MKKLRILSGLALGIFLVSCETPPVAGEGESGAPILTAATQQRLPTTFTVTGCDGQTVTVTGEIHLVTESHADAQGQTHFLFSTNFNGLAGTDASGNTFSGNGSGKLSVKSSGQSSQTFTQANNLHLIDQGSGDNQVIHFLSHFTVTPAGETTATFTNFSSECRG